MASPQEILRREISRTSEKEISVTLDASFGTVLLSKGERDKIVTAEYRREGDDRRQLEMYYDIDDERGELEINLSDERRHRSSKSSISWEELKDTHKKDGERVLSARFTDAIPLSLKIGIGAGKGDFDLTGLKVKRLKISAGASSAEVRCEEPNPIACETVEIESGVSKFTANQLANLNFRKMKFSGGVGAYYLDFSGKLQQKAYATIEVGFGTVTVYVPKSVPTRIIADENWFSSVDVDESFEKVKKNTYENDDCARVEKFLTLKIGSGVGSIKVRSR